MKEKMTSLALSDLNELLVRGKRICIIDLDNTLIDDASHEILHRFLKYCRSIRVVAFYALILPMAVVGEKLSLQYPLALWLSALASKACASGMHRLVLDLFSAGIRKYRLCWKILFSLASSGQYPLVLTQTVIPGSLLRQLPTFTNANLHVFRMPDKIPSHELSNPFLTIIRLKSYSHVLKKEIIIKKLTEKRKTSSLIVMDDSYSSYSTVMDKIDIFIIPRKSGEIMLLDPIKGRILSIREGKSDRRLCRPQKAYG